MTEEKNYLSGPVWLPGRDTNLQIVTSNRTHWLKNRIRDDTIHDQGIEIHDTVKSNMKEYER